MVNWAQACTIQTSRTLSQLQQATYGGCLFAVRAPRVIAMKFLYRQSHTRGLLPPTALSSHT